MKSRCFFISNSGFTQKVDTAGFRSWSCRSGTDSRYFTAGRGNEPAFALCFGENLYLKRLEENSRIALGFTKEPLLSLTEKWTGVSPTFNPSSRARITI